MARISLRAYNREIENLIERSQIDQAIAHCRHILKTFPKHIDTYRLLGKAFLESQRYGDAADIFQRVLSSMPEDFVSHVGMSIIREDEGNLDEALWHMERAFEMQPANGAIQDELRRLYGRRDGFEPPKVRLTRGALARMYTKGALYQQAIAELRSALAEDPKRLDLQSLLAHVYFKSGQRVEAVETCSNLLRKLPYSFEASRIMAEVLAGSERAEEARTYRQRVQGLDPYMAHVSPAAPSVESVPDQAVAIEKLVWQADQSLQGRSQPAWAASLGVDLQEESDKDDLPEWLAAAGGDFEKEDAEPEESLPVDEEPQEAPESGAAQAGEESQDWLSAIGEESDEEAFEDELPDWMQEAGWMPAGEESQEGPSGAGQEQPLETQEASGEDSPEEDLAEAEIPDWLQAMAPPEEDTLPEQEQAEFLIEEESDQEAELPDWMEEEAGAPEAEMEAEEPGSPEMASPESELPEWLADDTAAAAEAVSDEELPEWLSELDTDEGEEQPLASDKEEEILLEQVEVEEETPDWLSEIGEEGAVEAGAEPEEWAGEEEEELPDWLLEEEQVAPSAEQQEEPQADMEPEITDQVPEEASEPALAGELEPAEESAVEELAAEEPAAETAGAEQETEEPRTIEDEEAAYAWLEALAAKQGIQEGLLLEEEDRQEAPPEWVDSIESEQEEAQPSPAETPEVPELPGQPQAETVPMDELPIEELETEAEEAADELASEEAQESVPDWLMEGMAPPETQVPQAEIEEALEEPVESLPESGEEEAPVAPEGLPEAELDEAAEPASEFVQEGEPETVSELDDTQPTLVAEEPAAEQELAAPDEGLALEEQPEAEALDSEAAFAWLEGLAAKQGVEEGLLLDSEARQESPPDWVQEEPVESETPVQEEPPAPAEQAPEAAAEVSEEEQEPSGMPAWLQPEDSQVSPDEETKPTRIRPAAESEAAEPAEEIPSWLGGMPQEEPQAEAETPVQERPPATEEVPTSEAVEETSAETPVPEIPEESLAELEETPTEEALEETLEETPEQEAAAPDLSDEEAAFAWLESLAAKQGATEGLLLDDEERSETAPDWVQETAAEGEQEPAEIQMEEEDLLEAAEEGELEEIQTEEAAELEPALEQPEVKEPVDIKPAEEALEEPAAEVPQAPEWLQELETEEETIEPETPAESELEQEIEETPEAEAAASSEAAPEPEAETLEPPEWVKDETFAEEDVEVEQEQAVPELPSWLSEEALVEEQEDAWTPPVEKFDLNEASLADLEKLPGIGFIMAQEIVTHRDNYGPYERVEDLLRVPGFGEETLEPLRERLFVKAAQKEETGLPAFEGDEEAPEQVRQARQAFLEGDLEQATQAYLTLINDQEHLPVVIEDLKEALNRYPADARLWQALGDAYLRADQLDEALEAYDKAEELIR
jgi:competence ComEA-like helix-hairpin-helix protein